MTALSKILIAAILVLVESASSIAQYKFERPVLLNTEHGLPSNSIRGIKKGPDGFLWIATSDGLCRYDGNVVKQYKHDAQKNSIKNNNIYAVLPLKDEVWTGHNEGISVLCLKTNQFRHYQLVKNKESNYSEYEKRVSFLLDDNKDNIWIGTRQTGVWKYNRKSKKFNHFPTNKLPVEEPFIGNAEHILSVENSLFNDSITWAGTIAGLIEVNKISGKTNLYTFLFEDKKYQVAVNAFRRLYQHDDGLLYAGSWNAGVNIYDPKTKILKPLPVKNSIAKKILTSAIDRFYKHNPNQFWITCGSGLILYDIVKQDAVFVKENVQNEEKFYGVQYIDERNRVWNYNISGIQFFDPLLQQFSIYPYGHIFGTDWAFTFYIASVFKDQVYVLPRNADGFYIFDKEHKTWKRSPFFAYKEGKKLVVRGMAKQKNGELIISSDSGLFKYNPVTQKLAKIKIESPLKFNRWNEIVLDKNENLWISADGEGLLFWNRKQNKFQLFKEEIYGKLSQKVDYLRNLYCDINNNIWFTRELGYGVVINSSDTIHNFLYGKASRGILPFVIAFAEDKKGRIWMSSTKGLIGFVDVNTPQKGLQHIITLSEKGLEGYAFKLVADTSGNVWGITKNRLFSINKDDLSVKHFPFQYGSINPEFFHFSVLPANELVFGGRSNITLVNPEELQINDEKPIPYILNVQVLDKPEQKVLANNILNLKYKEKNLSINFSALAFTMGKNVRFRYKLEGLHDWIEAWDRRFVNYTNLKGGNYLFQLQAANADQDWNEQIAELPIHIDIPWFQSTWFYLIAISLVVTIIYMSYRYRINQIRKKEKLKTEYEKQLANVEMRALLAQMNPHFLFNSLNSIDSYIIKNQSKKASEYLNNFARLIRLILQNSKSNFITLKDEIETLDLYLQMESLRFRNRFIYKIHIDPSLKTEEIQIPPLIIQPYVENAIWHGIMHQQKEVKGKIDIYISVKNNTLTCVVQDNGIGRQKAMELSAQSSGPKKRSMGMQITRDRIEMINKIHNRFTTIEITDLKDEKQNAVGTKVQLEVPI
jgi:ligand-binding sensor domain-containing protein/two-component sensor histidine kinase